MSRREFGRRLSPRQAELLGLVERGFSRKEAAAAMGLSENTVKKHTKALLRKAQCGSTRDLIFRRLCVPTSVGANAPAARTGQTGQAVAPRMERAA